MPFLWGSKNNQDFPCDFDADLIVIEKVACYGMPVGETIFETVFWSGIFAERYKSYSSEIKRIARIERKDIKMHLCGSMRAKDGNIRQVLIDKFGEPGKKKSPGILYGMKGDQWAALAVAVAYSEINNL